MRQKMIDLTKCTCKDLWDAAVNEEINGFEDLLSKAERALFTAKGDLQDDNELRKSRLGDKAEIKYDSTLSIDENIEKVRQTAKAIENDPFIDHATLEAIAERASQLWDREIELDNLVEGLKKRDPTVMEPWTRIPGFDVSLQPAAPVEKGIIFPGIEKLLSAGLFDRHKELFWRGTAGSNQLTFYYIAKAFPEKGEAVLARYFRNKTGKPFDQFYARTRIAEFKREAGKLPRGFEAIDRALFEK
jgi:hypothetical protein